MDENSIIPAPYRPYIADIERINDAKTGIKVVYLTLRNATYQGYELAGIVINQDTTDDYGIYDTLLFNVTDFNKVKTLFASQYGAEFDEGKFHDDHQTVSCYVNKI